MRVSLVRCEQSSRSFRVRAIAAPLLACVIAIIVSGCMGGGSGSSSAAPASAPTNLTYPAKTLTGMVGIAISPDIASVMGSGVTYSVMPALPAGLMLDANTGIISGTATAAAAAANYVITAMNSAGSTTATISISIAVQPPSNLVYSPSTVNDTLGTAMQADVPTVNGEVDSFTIAPALPLGLSLDAKSGAISGTPAAFSGAFVYTVTAENSSGTTTAQITLAVNAGGKILLEQGHGSAIAAIRTTATRVLSEDISGHWVLWDYSSGNQIASGDGAITAPGPSPGDVNQLGLAGQLAVVQTSSQLQLYSATDGHLIGSEPTPSWWRLAADGGYLCAGTSSGLTAWTPAGDVAFTLTGDYSAAIAYAAAGQIQVADGPAGANAIETDTFPGGTSSKGPQFVGTFNSWFLDGARFITNLSNSVWVYSAAGTQQGMATLPSVQNLTGQGNWLWSTSQASTNAVVLSVYPIGGATAAATFSFGAGPTIVPSGTSIGVLERGRAGLSVVDLSGATPVRADYSPPLLADLTEFAAASASQWIAGTMQAVLVDGASISSQTRYFGFGAVFSIDTTPNVTAVSTAIGKLLLFDPSSGAQTGTIDTLSGKLQLSADGSVLAAAAGVGSAVYDIDNTLTFYSLPSTTVTQTIPSIFNDNNIPYIVDFALSASGTILGQTLLSYPSTGPNNQMYTRTITHVSDGSLIWMDTAYGLSETPILLSPSGTLSAVATMGSAAADLKTNIYNNGTLVATVPGTGEGWIDNGHLLVADFVDSSGSPAYSGYSIVGADGTVVSTVTASSGTLPLVRTVQFEPMSFPGSDRAYDPFTNGVYSLTTGQPLWQGPKSTSQGEGIGAAAGSVVVYEAGHQVVAATTP